MEYPATAYPTHPRHPHPLAAPVATSSQWRPNVGNGATTTSNNSDDNYNMHQGASPFAAASDSVLLMDASAQRFTCTSFVQLLPIVHTLTKALSPSLFSI